MAAEKGPSPVKSVWGVPLQSHVDLPSLSDVMSEELAKDLSEKEKKSEMKKIADQISKTEVDGAHASTLLDELDIDDGDDCTDDLLIAQMLQLQFDQVLIQLKFGAPF
jgi:hypothetical protein